MLAEASELIGARRRLINSIDSYEDYLARRLRRTFYSYLYGPTSRQALAALFGLFPILDQSDREELAA